MPEPLISALAQVPFVLAMLYATLRFLSHLKARDEMLVEQLADLTRAQERMTEILIRHDARTRPVHPRPPSERHPALRLVQGGK
jgi:hypothetical protein